MIDRRIIVVANRAPYDRLGSGGRPRPASGGLVAALAPAMRGGGKAWVAAGPVSEGSEGRHQVDPDEGYWIRQVAVPDPVYRSYYEELANRVLWPLFHGALPPVSYAAEPWAAYRQVNQQLAQATAEEADEGDLVWVHDYHLMLVPRLLRRLRPDLRIGFFLHTPFAPAQLFRTLPWRDELLAGLCGADLIGFHTHDDTGEFLRAVQALLGIVPGPCGGLHLGSGRRCIRVGAFPVGIDQHALEAEALRPETARRAGAIRRALGADREGAVVALGVDRLDYTKGIVDRLLAIELLLERCPWWRRRFTFVQIAVPSRTGVPEYRALRDEVERTVGRINGLFGDELWTPIRYLFRSVNRAELVAYYRAADLALVTSRRDGMNLVAKEYVASQVDGRGVLLLSEFAGAAGDLPGAVLVNPYDLAGLTAALRDALCLGGVESRRRMARMRHAVRRRDAHGWWRRFTGALARTELWHAAGYAAPGRPPTAVEAGG